MKTFTAEIKSRGQLTIPKKIRIMSRLEEGQIVSIIPVGDSVIITPRRLELEEARREIKRILKEADLEFSVENVRTSFQLLIKDIKDVDEFTYKNFSPAMINSRFNTIVANLKNLKKHDYSEELKEKLSHGKDWLS